MFFAGVLTGTYLNVRLYGLPRAHVDPHIFLAATSATPPQMSIGNSDAIIAVQSEKLLQVAAENQASKDDRKLLHDEIAKVHDIETKHFNDLYDRLNVDEAKIFTALWVCGALFGVLQIIPTILAIADFRAKKSKE